MQQTQVPRVIPKYEAFLKQFPTLHDLATAQLADVIRAWSGLGYNRRARYVWQAAQDIDKQGQFPRTVPELVALPGIGANTAGAILAYAYNQPVVFIETNVRTVIIHHYFTNQTEVRDTEVQQVLQELLTLNSRPPKEFYWVLMDYGTYLKAAFPNPNRRSKHYTKQSAFDGSKRQIRGSVLRTLAKEPKTLSELQAAYPDSRLQAVIEDLLKEQLISQTAGRYHL